MQGPCSATIPKAISGDVQLFSINYESSISSDRSDLASSHVASHNNAEMDTQLVTNGLPSSAIDVGIEEEKRISDKDVAQSRARAELVAVDTAGANSAAARLESNSQIMISEDATTTASNSCSVMTFDSTIDPNRAGPENEPVDGEEAEFETDSSPLENTSSDTSSLSSSSEDSDDGYKMLNPEEQARILMLGDGGSDDDGGGKNASINSNAIVKTQNERPEQIVERPALIVTEDMEIEELGVAENLVGNIVLIKARVSGEFRVLESGSVLCLKDRSVIGVVAETLGRVHQPLYSVLFTNAASIAEAGIEKSTKIFYVVSHSTFVFTQAISNLKGSDASNIHDEEVGDDEMEFSDDEAEAAYKRSQKIQREERRAKLNPGDLNGFSKPPRGRGYWPSRGRHNEGQQINNIRGSDGVTLSYDDSAVTVQTGVGDYDGPYIPLARPINYRPVDGRELPVESERPPDSSATPLDPGQSWRGRGRGNTRGPWRGRGRGREQRHGTNHSDCTQRLDNNHSLPTTHTSSLGSPSASPYPPSADSQNIDHYPQYPQPASLSFPTQPQSPSLSISYSQNSSSHQYNQALSQQNHIPQTSPSHSQQLTFSPSSTDQFAGNYTSATSLPPNSFPHGAFINPAFFGQHARQNGFSSSLGGRRESNSSPRGGNAAHQAAQERLDVLRRLSQGHRAQ